MSRTQGALIAIASVALSASVVIAQQAASPGANMPVPPGVPEWAYNTPPPPPGSPPPPTALPADDTAVIKISGTEKTMTRGALRGVKEIPDWYPEDRQGQMPSIVRSGKEGARACGFCHLADGSGRPENAPVSAYHPAYFIQQMEDFKNGLRRSADPRKGNTWNMIGFAKALTPEETRAAAEWFAQQPYPRRMKVIESKTAPKVRLQGGMHMKIPDNEGGGMEPIGDHIVEIPDDNLRSEARDTRMGWTAYVPPGTLNKGKQLAAKNNCSVCHGSNLEGVGPIPALAGRSPSYTVRQLFDMKTGTRRGPWSEVMKPIVANMSTQDMMAVAAYAASVAPPPSGVRSTR
jgi:cytochrome c553